MIISGDEVYFPQVRAVRNGDQAWRTLYSCPQHHQWEGWYHHHHHHHHHHQWEGQHHHHHHHQYCLHRQCRRNNLTTPISRVKTLLFMMFQQAYLMCWKSAYSFFGKVKLSLLLPNKYLLSQIYVFLWFWFVGVAIMSALAIVYRMVVILVPSLRLFMYHC